MTIKEWLTTAKNKLDTAEISTSRLDAEILLSDEFQKDRSWLHAHPDFTIPRPGLGNLQQQVEQRAQHEPLAYIRGKQEFYGREFIVSPDTLTPRPETETLVEMAIEVIKKRNISSVVDIGSGSGCIIISIALETDRKIELTGYEISENALSIARQNAKKLEAKVAFEQSDIQSSVNDTWRYAELVVANLPYVPNDFRINLAASHEPKIAIYGGNDGLDLYRTMFKKLSHEVKFVLTESMPPQHAELSKIANDAGFNLEKTLDFIQQFKRTS